MTTLFKTLFDDDYEDLEYLQIYYNGPKTFKFHDNVNYKLIYDQIKQVLLIRQSLENNNREFIYSLKDVTKIVIIKKNNNSNKKENEKEVKKKE